MINAQGYFIGITMAAIVAIVMGFVVIHIKRVK